MRIKSEPSKWQKVSFIAKATIFLVLTLIVVGSNLQPLEYNDSDRNHPSGAVVLPVIEPLVNLAVEREACASVNTEERRLNELSLIVQHRGRVVDWLDKNTNEDVPRHMLEKYVDFIGERVEPHMQGVVIALVSVESKGNPLAVSSHGAWGLTQIIPKWWESELKSEGIISGRRDLFDYRKSILAGQYILLKLSGNGTNIRKGLAKYNCNSYRYADHVLSRVRDLHKHLPVAKK